MEPGLDHVDVECRCDRPGHLDTSAANNRIIILIVYQSWMKIYVHHDIVFEDWRNDGLDIVPCKKRNKNLTGCHAMMVSCLSLFC